jgi:putative sterol carrier protein
MLSNGVMVFEDESYARNAKNWEADLRLASLAPELAELLQRISGHVVRLSGGWDIQQDIDSLLARARGEDAHA